MWSSNGVEVHGLDMVKKPLLIQNTVTGVNIWWTRAIEGRAHPMQYLSDEPAETVTCRREASDPVTILLDVLDRC